MTNQTTVIAMPVDDCNMSCGYCINPRLRTGKQMGQSTLENAVIKTVEHEGQRARAVRFIWHGGEPLLMEQAFYESVLDLSSWLTGKGYAIHHAMQSNATLLTAERAEFFIKNRFAISFSLDGPRDINDRTRLYEGAYSTFDDALRGIMIYKNLAGEASVICVVSSANVSRITEVYRFFAAKGIYTQFNPWFKVSGAADDLEVSPEEFGDAMKGLFDEWFFEQDPSAWGDDNSLQHILFACLYGESIGCTFRGNCQLDGTYSIDPEGNVGPCSRFYGNRSFVFGNVNDCDNFAEIAASDKRAQLQERHKLVTECDGCPYHPICNSGCMHHAFVRFGTVNRKDPLCPAYRSIFSHVHNRLEEALRKAEIN